MESKILGSQVPVELNLFGNNVNYKVPETLETDSDRFRAVNYQLMKCLGSQSASMETLRESLISCSHGIRLNIKPRTGPQGSRIAKDTKCMPSQASMENSEWDLRPGIGMSQWMSIWTLPIL